MPGMGSDPEPRKRLWDACTHRKLADVGGFRAPIEQELTCLANSKKDRHPMAPRLT